MTTKRLAMTVSVILVISQVGRAGPIGRNDFDNPTVLDFQDFSGFVGGPAYPAPWLFEGVRVTGFVSGGYVSVYPNSNNAVEVEFLNPVQRVGADVLYSITDPTRLEVYDVRGLPLEHVDGVGRTFLGVDLGAPMIAQARFIDLPDNWYTFPHIDNLHFEAVPEPGSMLLLAVAGLSIVVFCRCGLRGRHSVKQLCNLE